MLKVLTEGSKPTRERKAQSYTFGEAHILVKESLHLEDGSWKAIVLPYHKPQMNKADTLAYYTEKINRIMGWNKKVKFTPEVFAIPEAVRYEMGDLEGFDSVDDLFGFYEAEKIKISLGMVA